MREKESQRERERERDREKEMQGGRKIHKKRKAKVVRKTWRRNKESERGGGIESTMVTEWRRRGCADVSVMYTNATIQRFLTPHGKYRGADIDEYGEITDRV